MFTFDIFEKSHISLFQNWIRSNHIKEYWKETDIYQELEAKFIRHSEKGIHSFVIKTNQSHPIGYIQYYNAKNVGDGWWEQENPNTFGLDLMIGDLEWYGKGFGVAILKDFIHFIKAKEPSLKSIIVDPHPENIRAIKTFQKLGFIIEKTIKTPDGNALLMRLNV